MAEETKFKIYSFLLMNKGVKYTITELANKIKVSYPTVLKWVEVLIGERKINVEDWGNVKLVFIMDRENSVNNERKKYNL